MTSLFVADANADCFASEGRSGAIFCKVLDHRPVVAGLGGAIWRPIYFAWAYSVKINIDKPEVDMPARDFLFRLSCSYDGDDNHVVQLQVARQVEGGWVPFELNTLTPGFDIFCYALLTCQHTYLRLNCAEKGLLLERIDGEMHLSADDDWNVGHLLMSFSARLRSGEPDDATVDYIIERMQQCPVSKNIRPIPDSSVLLAFVER